MIIIQEVYKVSQSDHNGNILDVGILDGSVGFELCRWIHRF